MVFHYFAAAVVNRLSQLFCVFLVDAENNSFPERVRLLEEVFQIFRNSLCAHPERYESLKILGAVLTIRNFSTIAIYLPFARSPSSCIDGRNNAMHSVRGQKSVLDT